MAAGTIAEGEVHPIAHDAFEFVKHWIYNDISRAMLLVESMASCAIEGNILGYICGETLRRILSGEPVSDRYVLGLAWYLKMQYKDAVEDEI